jgi:hypothetical protein
LGDVPPIALVALGLVLAAAAALAIVRAARRSLLARIREGWATPVDRPRKLDAMAASHRSRASLPGARGSLDDRTWIDLDLDAVFAALDRTQSTLGQHALYHRLRTAPIGDNLDAFEGLVRRMSVDVPARERAQMALSRLQDPHGYDLWWLGRPEGIDTRRWYAVFPALGAITLTLLLLAPFEPAILPALIAMLAANVALRYATDRRIGAVASAFRQLAPVIATGESLRFLDGADIDPIVEPLRASVPRLRRLKTIARWVSGDPFMLSVSPNPLAVAVSDFVSAVYEYLNLLFLLDANGVYFGARDLRAGGAGFLRMLSATGEIDAAISVASYRAGRNDWCRPRFESPGTPAVFTDVRHPLLADAVPNTIALSPSCGVLVTGSNMSGKSTFLRTLGVTAVMAQTIQTCLAEGYEAPIFKVRSCIGRADDLVAGKSYYIVEVEAVLGLVRASAGPDPHMFLLDELFRGTNAVERIAAGQAVLRELIGGPAGPGCHVVAAATHDGELVELLTGPFEAYHFGDAVGPEGLVFDHRLHPGPATTRNAIALLRLHGAPDRVLARALTCAADLDRQRGTTLAGR